MEKIETLNQRLEENYGRFEDGRPTWRIVWSDDQREMRFGTYQKFSSEGVWLCDETGLKEVSKYEYLPHVYILERLIPVPIQNMTELTVNTSYEPVWAFKAANGDALPPYWEAIQLIIASVMNASARSVGAKYKPSELEDNSVQAKEARIDLLEKSLFGNETEIGNSLMQDSGVGFGTRKRNDQS